MFQIKWAHRSGFEVEPPLARQSSRLPRNHVKRVLFLEWEEHCVECAVPDCYKHCSLYVRRKDGRCARLAYGMYPNTAFTGHFDFGVDVRFRRWAKIQAELQPSAVPVIVAPHSLWVALGRLPRRLRHLSGRAYAFCTGAGLTFNEFVLECFSPHNDSFTLILEYFTLVEKGVYKTHYRGSFRIYPGMNHYTVPFEQFGIRERTGHVMVYPDGSREERRLVFTWLDFVAYSHAYRRSGDVGLEKPPRPSDKVKCVAWDLDNTLWAGTLLETSDPGLLSPRPGVRELLTRLDERGVIQTIISKNNHDDAWRLLGSLGLQEYFVFPAINWGQKSANLKAVADKLNIGIDTFAFIDDSAFERAEVQTALPQVRVYNENAIDRLLSYPEFDIPVSGTSRSRRLSYFAEMRRETIRATFEGGYDDFLRSCEMQMRIFSPSEPEDITRCWELVQRSNQLNLSTKRYSTEEFRELLTTPGLHCFAFDCRDKYGDYGIVGFASVDERGSNPVLVDFVLSCRIAQKKVEHAFLEWLAANLRSSGWTELEVNLVVTKKNKPLRLVFGELPFVTREQDAKVVRMRLPLENDLHAGDISRVTTESSCTNCPGTIKGPWCAEEAGSGETGAHAVTHS